MAVNPYKKPITLTLAVAAEMQESIAGYDSFDLDKEIGFAVATLDDQDTDQLRWLAALCIDKVERIEGEQR